MWRLIDFLFGVEAFMTWMRVMVASYNKAHPARPRLVLVVRGKGKRAKSYFALEDDRGVHTARQAR